MKKYSIEKYKKYWGWCSNDCNGQKFTPVEESNRINEANSDVWEKDIYDIRLIPIQGIVH